MVKSQENSGIFSQLDQWQPWTGVYSWIKTTTNFDKDPKSSGFNVLYIKHYNILLSILYTFIFVQTGR